MATNYPGSVDSPVDPTPTDPMNNPSHAGEHDLENDAIVAIENTVGFTGSFNFLPVVGGSMSGPIAMGTNKITGLANGSAPTDAANISQITGGGACGVSGVPGACGVSGVAGSAGACGVSGVAGACGVSGTAGVAGACGVSGTAGSAGACGVSGTAGSAGACGVSGVAGACGVSGTAGSNGTAGACGVSGVAGACGVSGTAGSNGSAGACGVSGVAGACGVSGVAGSGACGVSGVSGVAGACGVSGVSGVSGSPDWPVTVVSQTLSGNAVTVAITTQSSKLTNNSSATATITLATASAVDGQSLVVRFYDFAGTPETLTWVNTENSSVSVPTTSNGSTTLPVTVAFVFNGGTSKWRCAGVA